MTALGMSAVCLASTVVDVEELEVVQRTAQRVGVGRARPTNDEVDRARAAREALTADVVLVGAADGLGVDGSRQRRQEEHHADDVDDGRTSASTNIPDTGTIRR